MIFNTKLHNFAANVQICTEYLKFCNNHKKSFKTIKGSKQLTRSRDSLSIDLVI